MQDRFNINMEYKLFTIVRYNYRDYNTYMILITSSSVISHQYLYLL